MVEGFILGVPFVAAVVYLVVEILDLKIWWNKRRQPPPKPKIPRSLGDTWPHDRREEAEEEWRKMLDRDNG